MQYSTTPKATTKLQLTFFCHKHFPLLLLFFPLVSIPLLHLSIQFSAYDDSYAFEPNLRKRAVIPPVFQIAVPFCGKSSSLFDFTERLGHSFSTLESNIQLQLLVTKCLDDDDSLYARKFEEILQDKAGGISVQTIPLNIKNGSERSREQAQKALTERACNSPGCIFSMLDIDLDIKPSFVESAMSRVEKDKTMYYPITFSEYDPSSVRAAETIFGPLEQHNEHRGQWRKSGDRGLYAISGETLQRLRLENDRAIELDKLAEEHGLTLVREREAGLTHRWDPEECISEFVNEPKDFSRCLGSPFIQQIRTNDKRFFDHLVNLPIGPTRSSMAGTIWAADEFMKFSKEQDDFTPGKIPEVGDMVSYFYNYQYDYQLAIVLDKKFDDEEEEFKLKLHFLTDNEEGWFFYEGRSMNAQETYSFDDCSESLHTNSSILEEPSATVSCRRVNYRAPRKLAFEETDKVIVGVLSSAKGRERRDVIRKTWANKEFGRGIFFIVSGPWEDVAEEHREKQDLIWIEGEEHVLLITYKTAMFFNVVNNMANELGLEYTHALKTDDDSYVAMERLQALFAETHNVDYWGQCGRYSKPFRDPEHKYYVSREEYPKEYFPPYCQGGGFVLSRKTVECAAVEMQRTPFVSMEDVYMGMVAERCGAFKTIAVPQHLRIYRGNSAQDKEVSKPTMEGGKIIQHKIVDAKDMEAHHAALIEDTKKD